MSAADFHHRVRQAIEDLGARCHASDGPVDPQDACPMCDECQADYGAATRALFAVIYLHRPESEPEPPRGTVFFPGWRPTCMACEAMYPCATLHAVAQDLGVEWDDGD